MIVPPCKVGQAVWSNEPFVDGRIREGHITVLFCDKSGVYSFSSGFDSFPAACEFLVEDLGKTVFLAREEAEAAVREVQGDA